MKRNISIGLVGVVMSLGLWGCAEVYAETTGEAVSSTSAIAELQAKIRELQAQIQSLQQRLRELHGQASSTMPMRPGLHLGEIRKNICFGAKNDDDVRVVQMRLKESGYFKDEVTGNYLTKTDEAVRTFQKERGIPPVECVGPKTREAFIRIKASSTPDMILQRACPNEWIINRMPTVGTSTVPSEYLIFEGKRRELKEFDVVWIKTNCGVRPQVVY